MAIAGGSKYATRWYKVKKGIWAHHKFYKEMNREEMEATSNSPRLAVIIFSGLVGGNEYKNSGGQ